MIVADIVTKRVNYDNWRREWRLKAKLNCLIPGKKSGMPGADILTSGCQ